MWKVSNKQDSDGIFLGQINVDDVRHGWLFKVNSCASTFCVYGFSSATVYFVVGGLGLYSLRFRCRIFLRRRPLSYKSRTYSWSLA